MNSGRGFFRENGEMNSELIGNPQRLDPGWQLSLKFWLLDESLSSFTNGMYVFGTHIVAKFEHKQLQFANICSKFRKKIQ